jgi:penicillin amidase
MVRALSHWFRLGALCFLWVLCGDACKRREQALPPLVAQVTGTVQVAGLTAAVRVVRDRSGIPHIYAQSQDDLFFAQGFVQAQDRLFQIDLWRRSVQGRLSEVLGPNFVERDAMTRRIQYRGDPDAEWASYGSDTKAIAAAFVRGVNAWVALARERPPEEFVLAGWKPEVWAPEDLLNRTDAFVASSGALEEIFRARLVAAVGAGRASALLQGHGPIAVPAGLDATTINPIIADVIRRAGTTPFFMGLAAPVASIPPPGDESRRSAVESRPREGGPSTLLRTGPTNTDTVTTLDHPSRRYLIHLVGPGWNVAGAAAPWLPGVVAGHNERIAWDVEPFDADVQDVFVERLNPANPHQVDDNGRWVDTRIVTETILIRGNPKPFMFEAEYTPRGMLVALDRARHLAFALRWSGSEPGAAGELAALAIGRASSWPEFREALARWQMPPRRFIYADVEGHRGFQAAALIPVRRGWDGALPAPAWPGTHRWNGWRALDALPHALDPRGGGAARPRDTSAASILKLARAHPDRADALLRKIEAAGSLTVQRALIVDAVAETMRALPASGRPVVFAHPLGISTAARRRFNIGPFTPADSAGPPFALSMDPSGWDRSAAINAPGQSGSPVSPFFANLAQRWAAGERAGLAFSESAVQAGAESTLTLTPAR